MTKTKAIKLMLEHARYVLNPAFALKIAKAFGYTLTDLGITAVRVIDFPRMTYTEETANLKAVSTSRLAQEIALKETGQEVRTRMHGAGSGAQDIVEQAAELLTKNEKEQKQMKEARKMSGYPGDQVFLNLIRTGEEK